MQKFFIQKFSLQPNKAILKKIRQNICSDPRVYALVNLSTSKMYVGSSGGRLYRRLYEHLYTSGKGNSQLHSDVTNQLPAYFAFLVLETFPGDQGLCEMVVAESRYIHYLRPEYNLAQETWNNSTGWKHSGESKEKMRISRSTGNNQVCKYTHPPGGVAESADSSQIFYFKNIKDARLHFGVNRKTISRALNEGGVLKKSNFTVRVNHN